MTGRKFLARSVCVSERFFHSLMYLNYRKYIEIVIQLHNTNEKPLRQTPTLRAGCSKAEPKNFAPLQTPFPGGGAGRPKFDQLEMVTAFTYKPSLVRIDARNFELSW